MAVSHLKMVDAGFSANTFALLNAPSIPFIVLAPFVFSEYLTGYRSMQSFLTLYTVR